MSERIVVRIDPMVVGMIPRYLDSCRRHIGTILSHVEQRNFTEIQLIGHSLKGSGGSFGLDEISRFGKGIEDTARNRDEAGVKTWLYRLESYLSALHIETDLPQ